MNILEINKNVLKRNTTNRSLVGGTIARGLGVRSKALVLSAPDLAAQVGHRLSREQRATLGQARRRGPTEKRRSQQVRSSERLRDLNA